MTTETELKDDVRETTGYTSELVLSVDGLDTAYRNAKRKIRVAKALPPNHPWLDPDNPVGEENALFWFTCLFAKVQTGELDSQDIQVGAVNQDTLLANDNGTETSWYRNAKSALRSYQAGSMFSSRGPARGNRTYDPGTYEEQDGAASSGGSGGGDVDIDTDL
jgi:hypothetical protein